MIPAILAAGGALVEGALAVGGAVAGAAGAVGGALLTAEGAAVVGSVGTAVGAQKRRREPLPHERRRQSDWEQLPRQRFLGL